MPTHPVDDYLQEVIRISQKMIDLAEQGDSCRHDAGCGIVFGSVRDKAYKVRKLAEQELRKHQDADAAAGGPAAPTRDDEHPKPRA